MASLSFNTFLLMGMGLMFVVMLITGRFYKIPVWKIAVACVLLTVTGVLGAYGMAFLEAGFVWTAGRSFYGAVFLAPPLMWLVAKLLREPYGRIMDISAPAECIMLALLKYKCTIDGCCFGRMMTVGGQTFRFPSQWVECIVALILMVVFVVMIFKKKYEDVVFPYYMLIYGIVRFCLNTLRETTPWILGLPMGHFWSIISAVIGVIWIRTVRRKKKA